MSYKKKTKTTGESKEKKILSYLKYFLSAIFVLSGLYLVYRGYRILGFISIIGGGLVLANQMFFPAAFPYFCAFLAVLGRNISLFFAVTGIEKRLNSTTE